jgi:hypothetical protein
MEFITVYNDNVNEVKIRFKNQRLTMHKMKVEAWNEHFITIRMYDMPESDVDSVYVTYDIETGIPLDDEHSIWEADIKIT